MSIATLNRITREQTVFYNTKRERDYTTCPPNLKKGKPRATSWSENEVNILYANSDKPITWFKTKLFRSYDAIRNMRRLYKSADDYLNRKCLQK